MTWTDAKIDHLRRLWTDGKTANVISNMLGVTRNAVIGKAHRMGMPHRASPIKPAGSGERPRMVREHKPRRLDLKIVRESDARAELPKPPRVPAPVMRPSGTCQFIAGNGLPWTKCGQPAVHGSWCAEHRALCFDQRPLARL